MIFKITFGSAIVMRYITKCIVHCVITDMRDGTKYFNTKIPQYKFKTKINFKIANSKHTDTAEHVSEDTCV